MIKRAERRIFISSLYIDSSESELVRYCHFFFRHLQNLQRLRSNISPAPGRYSWRDRRLGVLYNPAVHHNCRATAVAHAFFVSGNLKYRGMHPSVQCRVATCLPTAIKKRIRWSACDGAG